MGGGATLGGEEGGRGTPASASSISLSPSSPLPPPQPKAPPSSPKRKKGPRPKHVPQRMCVACREHDTKRGLHRIVRTPEGAVEPDPTGRRNGRGAYLCGRAACWEKALSSGMLTRALNVEIDQESLDALRRYAATLPLETSEAAGTAPVNKGGEA